MAQVWTTESDSVRYVHEALEGESADDRREAVTRLGSSRHLENDTVLDALCAIAKTDNNPAVRCAAIRAVSESDGPKPVAAVVAVISAQEGEVGVVPPPPEVRTDALVALESLAERELLTGDSEVRAMEAALGLAKSDPVRDVQLAAVRLLGHIRRPEAVSGLIDALQYRDFGIVYEAERSLHRLTGKRFDHDARAWKEWMASVPDPISNDASALAKE